MRCLWEIFAVMSAVDVLIYRTCCQCCYSVEVSLTYLFTYITKFNQTKTIQRSQNRISGNPVKKNNLTSFLNLYENSYKVKYLFIILFVLQDKSDLPRNVKFVTLLCNLKLPRNIWICFKYFFQFFQIVSINAQVTNWRYVWLNLTYSTESMVKAMLSKTYQCQSKG